MGIFAERESDIRAYCRVYPVVFDKAVNARQTDEDGKEYIDFFAGAGVLNFGHNNENMKRAMINHLESNGVLHSLDMHTTVKRTFIEQFVKTVLEPRKMPHKLQFMGPTGTNSVEAALKLARRATGRQNIVAFTHAFHGMTLGALACTANQHFRGAAGVPLNHVRHEAFGCETPCMGCEQGCGVAHLDTLRAQYKDASTGITPPAAFLVETIQAEGGVNVASKEWLQALAALAKDVGSLLIIDDIQVGVGRTGSFFSFDDLGIDPDIVCLAKGIGGMGTPMALNLVKPEYDKLWAPGEHTGTFRGQSLSFVAGTEAIKYFENDTLMAEVKVKEKAMHAALEPLSKKANVQVRGKGMIIGLDLGDGAKAAEVVKQCFAKGLLIASCGIGGRVVKLIPPLTIPDEDLKEGLDILVTTATAVLEAA